MRLRLPTKNEAGEIEAAGDMLIFVSGHAPILGKQILYFIDPEFSKRALIPTAQSDSLYPRATAEIAMLPKQGEDIEKTHVKPSQPPENSPVQPFEEDVIIMDDLFDDEVVLEQRAELHEEITSEDV